MSRRRESGRRGSGLLFEDVIGRKALERERKVCVVVEVALIRFGGKSGISIQKRGFIDAVVRVNRES